jgi:endonuclease YncB( thermonuclease family)
MRNVLSGVVFPLLVVMAAFTGGASRAEEPGCRLTLLASGTVSAVVDGRTLILADGREVRLPGIEVPAPEPSEQRSAMAYGIIARDALAALVNGQEVVLRHLHPATDRYGRLIAHVFVKRDGVEALVARDLLTDGHARLSLTAGEKPCAGELIAAERNARAGKLGL